MDQMISRTLSVSQCAKLEFSSFCFLYQMEKLKSALWSAIYIYIFNMKQYKFSKEIRHFVMRALKRRWKQMLEYFLVETSLHF